ncbi:ran-binding protein 3 [Teleopsis dalmanni]|uniref:ran-binding protein 3 n=1 Tax=Teleopsis dalmanni TaxID=139649 RepID=UPI0018CDBBF6|nr:ran-binding protein 3 [Teleopsis dalmanni]
MMSENNDTSNESNSLGSDSIFQSSRLAASSGNPVLRLGVLRPSVLGPSVLGSSANNEKTPTEGNVFNSKDDVNTTSNPFMKDQDEDDDDGAVGGTSKKDGCGEEEKKSDDDDEEPDERPDPLKMLRKNGLERANLFAAAKNSIPRVEKSGFVFGENVHERVLSDNLNSDKPESSSKPNELLFSSVIENANKTNDAEGNKEAEAKSLTEVAREYEESRAQKRKYEEVETFTGEENESNIVDINCKLFAFENSNWEERGRGSLRLNDSKSEHECSRVVFRTAGNLRLLLNTKVWAGMVSERPSQKSLRLTAMDNTGKIKVFLVMARPLDISQLHQTLQLRINARKISHPEETSPPLAESNGNCLKNGNGNETEVDKAAAIEVPENDDLAEPSPKKTVAPETVN